MTALTCQPELPLIAAARGRQILLWDTSGQLIWQHQLQSPCYRLALDGRELWLAVPGDPFLYFRLSDGSLAHRGPENFAAGAGSFGQGQIFPEFRPWVTHERDLWTPAIANDGECGVLWNGQAVSLRTGRAGPRFEGFRGQPGHITIANDWVALANDSWVGVFEKQTGQLKCLVEACGSANSGVAYNGRGNQALRAWRTSLQAWDLAAGRIEAELDAEVNLSSVAGWGPYFAGDCQGTLYRVEGF